MPRSHSIQVGLVAICPRIDDLLRHAAQTRNPQVLADVAKLCYVEGRLNAVGLDSLSIDLDKILPPPDGSSRN